MSDLISREELTKKLEYLCDCLCDYSKKQREFMCDACKLGAVIDAVEKMSSVDPERKTGKWHLLDECANEGWYCDQCHKKVFRADFSNTMKKYKFCPNCGAKMEVEE